MKVKGKAAKRLDSDLIIWLTTVSDRGQPQTSPVWFLWDGSEFLIYSLDSQRVRNIEQNPRISLNLDGNGEGGDIVTIEGEARLDPDTPPAYEVPEYVAKYKAKMDAYGWAPEKFSADYPVPILVTPTRIRAW